ncbi:hypothetical protein [Citreimonas salinaria]|uniref:Uncharacterized protein n=1 Tax=Citreimonas salinaria TaxID=321339 RepID=A0A1H3N1B5_9RHOB|nr:hypothetical protein [Citreimonas salinaria]SDY82751.1 hypothetical protein SAMN05444340_11985 [Citreimonas salinaria]
MNSIIYTHFATPGASVSAGGLEVALHRLGAWLDAEQNTLGRLLAQAGRSQATGALAALDQLHLDPDAGIEDLRDLLEDARTCLEILLETLREIPSRCRLETAWGLSGPASFDTHLRWSAARLEDIIATLDRALAA